MPHHASRHRDEIQTIVLSILATAAIWAFAISCMPIMSGVRVTTPAGDLRSESMPYLSRGAPVGNYTVSFDLALRSFVHPFLFRAIGDDCIVSMVVNGRKLRYQEFNSCDVRYGRIVDLRSYVQYGTNTVVAVVRNDGWDSGLSFRPSMLDPTFVVPFVMNVGVVLLIMGPFFRRKSKHYLPKKWNALPRAARMSLAVAGLLALAALCGYELWTMGHAAILRLRYEMGGPATVDTTLYWTVGKGMLLGKQPYVDLFETKPPGIFVLSALSYAATGTSFLTHVAEVAAESVLFFTGALLAILNARRLPVAVSSLLAVVGFPFALYVAERSGEVQVESFGAAFLVAYAAIVAFWKTESAWKLLASSVTLLLAVGFKEPFVFCAAAIALVLSDSPKDFWRSFALPLSLALLGGMLFLFFSGNVGGYVGIYLDEMVNRHIGSSEGLFARAGNLVPAWSDARSYSPYLPWILLSAFALSWLAKLRRARGLQGLLAVSFAHLLALYFAQLALAVGGPSFNHHYAFHVAFFVACGFAVAAQASRAPRAFFDSCVAVSLLLSIAPFSMAVTIPDYDAALQGIRFNETRARAVAEKVDMVMRTCGMDDYVFIGPNGWHPFAYTAIPPLGPNFFQYDYFFNGARPFFESTMVANVEKTDLVVYHANVLGRLSTWFDAYLDENFTQDLSRFPCAGSIRNGADNNYVIYVRNRFDPTPPGISVSAPDEQRAFAFP